jgi:IS5 family transposase
MRKKEKKQMPLMIAGVDHPHAVELERINQILDGNPTIYDLVFQDLTHNIVTASSGANGMSAKQVLRAAVLKQMENFSYEALAFHILDSISYRGFCGIGFADKGFKKSALCNNIKAISHETWEAINRIFVGYAEDKGIEKARESRIDCTVVETNIHHPLDSSLLYDCVRVLARKLGRLKEAFNTLDIHFTDHTRRAKRRMLAVMNAKGEEDRKKSYIDLLKVSQKTVSYTQTAISLIEDSSALSAQSILGDLKEIAGLTHKVIDQTERRVIKGESVPASEKIVSIFEPHSDVIKKDRRETYYGHKICLSGGASNLITDCLIVDGNPADSDLTVEMLDRQKGIYGRYPLKVALDGGFASKDNLAVAKRRGIKDVCFSKKRGLEEEDMCRSHWVYKRLRNFRAGIESGISWLKRCFGLTRCTWKTLNSFKCYVWASIVSANLLTLARKQMA